LHLPSGHLILLFSIYTSSELNVPYLCKFWNYGPHSITFSTALERGGKKSSFFLFTTHSCLLSHLLLPPTYLNYFFRSFWSIPLPLTKHYCLTCHVNIFFNLPKKQKRYIMQNKLNFFFIMKPKILYIVSADYSH
jgi:hypothetical protein